MLVKKNLENKPIKGRLVEMTDILEMRECLIILPFKISFS